MCNLINLWIIKGQFLGSKNKLKRFIENESFKNLLQPSREEIISGDFNLRADYRLFFKNENPLVLELGCGKGEYSIGLAKLNQNNNYIGIDIKGARIWRGAKTAVEEKIQNVLFIRTQVELLDLIFNKNEIDQIWLTFPDPQIKFKRRKHRLTNFDFIQKYKKILSKNGTIHLKTDSEFLHGYTLGILESMGINPCFSEHNIYKNNNAPKEVLDLKTHYEKTFLKKEKNISYLKFKL